jgi:hypothetical protein
MPRLVDLGAKPSLALSRTYVPRKPVSDNFKKTLRNARGRVADSLLDGFIAASIERGSLTDIPEEWLVSKDKARKMARTFRLSGHFHVADRLDKIAKGMQWQLDMSRDWWGLYLQTNVHPLEVEL